MESNEEVLVGFLCNYREQYVKWKSKRAFLFEWKMEKGTNLAVKLDNGYTLSSVTGGDHVKYNRSSLAYTHDVTLGTQHVTLMLSLSKIFQQRLQRQCNPDECVYIRVGW